MKPKLNIQKAHKVNKVGMWSDFSTHKFNY